ncbi:hypothetical protein [Corynebacterium pilosum]|uniref:Uncharacterized protein n=1 Tax=Corynebacterium pilosum TaxID=35756 RepID=A0A376CLD1_9CORY|nr:hypothetical protein [Corynebacterium pilosum]STC68478.1 Uncharacterised protein [Corynebacterium pilosum]
MGTPDQIAKIRVEPDTTDLEPTPDARRLLIEELSEEVAAWSAELNKRLA